MDESSYGKKEKNLKLLQFFLYFYCLFSMGSNSFFMIIMQKEWWLVERVATTTTTIAIAIGIEEEEN